MKNELSKSAVYSAFLEKTKNAVESMSKTHQERLEETLEKPADVMDSATSEIITKREIDATTYHRTNEQYEKAKTFTPVSKKYSTVKEGALMIYKNGAKDAVSEAMFFGPFTGTVNLYGIKVKGLEWNALVEKKLQGKKAGDKFSLPTGTYTITDIM